MRFCWTNGCARRHQRRRGGGPAAYDDGEEVEGGSTGDREEVAGGSSREKVGDMGTSSAEGSGCSDDGAKAADSEGGAMTTAARRAADTGTADRSREMKEVRGDARDDASFSPTDGPSAVSSPALLAADSDSPEARRHH